MSGEVKSRHKQANYLNVSTTGTDSYKLMGAGFTDLNEVPAAQMSSKKYVNDTNATKRITGYDWSTAFTTDIIRSEEAIDFICNIGEKQLTGRDAETDYVIVDLDKETSDGYAARKFRVAVEVASFENNEGEMTATGNLLGIGDVTIGSFDPATNTFKKEA